MLATPGSFWRIRCIQIPSADTAGERMVVAPAPMIVQPLKILKGAHTPCQYKTSLMCMPCTPFRDPRHRGSHNQLGRLQGLRRVLPDLADYQA